MHLDLVHTARHATEVIYGGYNGLFNSFIIKEKNKIFFIILIIKLLLQNFEFMDNN